MKKLSTLVIVGFILLLFTLIRKVAEVVGQTFARIDTFLSPVLDPIGKGLEALGVESRFWSYVALLVIGGIIIRALFGETSKNKST